MIVIFYKKQLYYAVFLKTLLLTTEMKQIDRRLNLLLI